MHIVITHSHLRVCANFANLAFWSASKPNNLEQFQNQTSVFSRRPIWAPEIVYVCSWGWLYIHILLEFHRRNLFFNIISILSLCNYNSGRMTCLISFVWAWLSCVEREASKIQKENIFLPRDLNSQPLSSWAGSLDYLASSDLHHFIWIISTRDNICINLVMVKYVLELHVYTVR